MAAVGPPYFHSTTTLSDAPTGGSATLTDVILANSQGVVTATQSLGPTSIPITTSSLSSQIPATSGYSTSTSSSSSASGTLVTTPATSHTQSPTTSNTTAAGSSGRTGGHSASSDGRLSNGTVAGVVVAAAIGLSLIASILTFLVMRRRRSSKGNQDEQSSNGHYALKSGISSQQSSPGSRLESRAPFVTGTLSNPITNESHFPQPADDATVESRVKTMLDQIELHVENFYQQNSELRSPVISDSLAMFESPSLPNSLASLLEQTTIATPIIKHALAYFITSCISTNSKIDSTLLPAEFVTLPRTVATAKRGGSAKPDFDQSMSRWRVLTAYLRPSPSQDPEYFAERDRRISEYVRAFSRDFASWRNLKYKDEDRARSLSAIFRSAAELGIWMFSQPTDLQFRWPEKSEMGPDRVAVTPALIKMTDEMGQASRKPQVMLEAMTKSIR